MKFCGASKMTSRLIHQMVTERAVIKGCNPQHLLRLSMFDFSLMLWMKLLVAYRIHLQSNKFATGMGNKVWRIGLQVTKNLMTVLLHIP